MGAMDFLKTIEGHVLDAATYGLLNRNFEMLEQNNRLLQDKNELLESKVAELEGRVRELETENSRLRKAASAQNEFVVLEGFAFRRGPDGNLDETALCPNCHKVIGSPRFRLYTCVCGYTRESRTLPSVLARGYKEGSSKR